MTDKTNNNYRGPNEYVNRGDHVELILCGVKKGVEKARTLVDKEDLARILEFRWYLHGRGYVVTKHKSMLLHRFILGNKSEQTDHINHNRLDNRKKNLRPCSYVENARHRRAKGVYWIKRDQAWVAKIYYEGRQISLGYFKKYEDAKDARNKATTKYFKEYGYQY